jgi:SsrA-binding protein
MAKDNNRFSNNINIKNKRASFEYEFIEKFTAGIALSGTEIKSIREGKVNLTDAYCYIDHKNELFVKHMNISPYIQGSHYNHEPQRERKLLLTKKELKRISVKAKDEGITIVPTRLFLTDRGFAKLEIAVARGKKLHDKRDSIKEKDIKRELSRLKI